MSNLFINSIIAEGVNQPSTIAKMGQLGEVARFFSNINGNANSLVTITGSSQTIDFTNGAVVVATNANYFMDGNVVGSNGVLTGNPNRIGIITNQATTTYADFVNRLKLSTTKLSGTTQGAAINNGTEVTQTIVSPLSFTSINLACAGNGGGHINAAFSNIIISKQADNSTQRTGVYNYIRSINNNAF